MLRSTWSVVIEVLREVLAAADADADADADATSRGIMGSFIMLEIMCVFQTRTTQFLQYDPLRSSRRVRDKERPLFGGGLLTMKLFSRNQP